jgi:hypothetical protein
MSGGDDSASSGGYHASAGLGGSLNGGLFAQTVTPDNTSASAGLAVSSGFGGSLKSQAHVGSAAESTTNASAETENYAPQPKRPTEDIKVNVFNVSSS